MRGALVLEQPQRGYRFTQDPLLLASFVLTHARRRRHPAICDFGAGCGVLGLSLLVRLPTATLVAAELQPRLAELARHNVELNHLEHRARVVAVDLADARAARAALPGARFEWAVSNPPYQPLGRGHVNPDSEQAIARHEVRLPLDRLCLELRRVLVDNGQAALIYPAARLDDLLRASSSAKLALRIMQPVSGHAREAASRVLVLLDKSAVTGKVQLLPPLIEHDDDGAPSAELRRATEGDA